MAEPRGTARAREPAPEAAELLETVRLQKCFGAVTAADEISVRIEPGSITSLIGSNGAGKTTFVNMVTGYTKPDSGQIHFHGRDITRLTPRSIARLGIRRSFQMPQLCAGLTALENMLVALSISGEARLSAFGGAHKPEAIDRAEEILARFTISEYRDRLVPELPGGVRKLLDIAMAIAGRPRLVLLDEPTSGVAGEEKFPIMDVVVQALASEQVTILFVEHDMEIVTRYAQRVLAFYNGGIIADDAPDEALRDERVQLYVTGTLR